MFHDDRFARAALRVPCFLLPASLAMALPAPQTFDKGVPVTVTQPPSATRIVSRVNNHVLKQMDRIPGFDASFVWQDYHLKGVQGVPTSEETSDDYLADITIENSQPGIQLFRGGAVVDTTADPTTLTQPVNRAIIRDAAQNDELFSMGGCMGCHGIAQTQNGFDFSFLYFGANGGGYSPDTLGVPDQALLMRRPLEDRGVLER